MPVTVKEAQCLDCTVAKLCVAECLNDDTHKVFSRRNPPRETITNTKSRCTSLPTHQTYLSGLVCPSRIIVGQHIFWQKNPLSDLFIIFTGVGTVTKKLLSCYMCWNLFRYECVINASMYVQQIKRYIITLMWRKEESNPLRSNVAHNGLLHKGISKGHVCKLYYNVSDNRHIAWWCHSYITILPNHNPYSKMSLC